MSTCVTRVGPVDRGTSASAVGYIYPLFLLVLVRGRIVVSLEVANPLSRSKYGARRYYTSSGLWIRVWYYYPRR